MKILVWGSVKSFSSKAQWLPRLRFAFSQSEKQDEWAMTSQIFSSLYLFACILFLLLFPSPMKLNWNLALSQSHSSHQSIFPHTPGHHSHRGVGVLLTPHGQVCYRLLFFSSCWNLLALKLMPSEYHALCLLMHSLNLPPFFKISASGSLSFSPLLLLYNSELF